MIFIYQFQKNILITKTYFRIPYENVDIADDNEINVDLTIKSVTVCNVSNPKQLFLSFHEITFSRLLPLGLCNLSLNIPPWGLTLLLHRDRVSLLGFGDLVLYL